MNEPDTVSAWAGLGLAVVAVAGSLWLSMGLGLLACPLCYYQRTFVMGALGVLLVGTAFGLADKVSLAALALPAALAGAIIGGMHVRLELAGKMECPLGVGGIGTAPQQALAAQGLLAAALLYGVLAGRLPGAGWGPALVGVVLAAAMAYGCFVSVAMPAPPPPKAYETPPVICRPLPNPHLPKG